MIDSIKTAFCPKGKVSDTMTGAVLTIDGGYSLAR